VADFVGCRFLPGWNNMMFFRYIGIFRLIIFIIIIALIVYLIINRSKSNENIGRYQKTPLDIIKERYAKGEISEEEFERMKKNLTK